MGYICMCLFFGDGVVGGRDNSANPRAHGWLHGILWYEIIYLHIFVIYLFLFPAL